MNDHAASVVVVFVRHVDSVWSERGILQGRADPPLAPAALQQIPAVTRLVQASLHDVASVAIAASPLVRALETARHLAHRLHPVSFDVCPFLAETDLGDWSGRTYRDLLEDDPSLAASYDRLSPDLRWPGSSEDYRATCSAATSGLQELVERAQPGGAVLVVSHGMVLQGILALWALDSLDLAARFNLVPGSVTRARIGKAGVLHLDWVGIPPSVASL